MALPSSTLTVSCIASEVVSDGSCEGLHGLFDGDSGSHHSDGGVCGMTATDELRRMLDELRKLAAKEDK